MKTKLILFATSTTSVALLVFAGTLASYDQKTYKTELSHELVVEGGILGTNCAAPLAFGDAKNASEVLSALSSNSRVRVGAVYDLSGKLFSAYSAQDQKTPVPKKLPGPERIAAEKGFSALVPIRHKGELLGYIYLRGGESEFTARRRNYYQVAAVSIGLAALLSIFVASWLQRLITKPIDRLVTSMAVIGREKDYSHRIHDRRRDEIGQLIQSFNAMLSEIEERDQGLELRVQQRTEALTNEISVRERAEQELSQALIAANAANEAKSQFLANMSHEIRTPINGVMGMAAILGETDLNQEQRESLNTISECSETLLAIVNDVLNLSTIKSGQTELIRDNFNLRSVLNGTISKHMATAESKQIVLRADLDPSTEVSAVGDALNLDQVLCNLIENALKFTTEGEVVLEAQLLGQGETHTLVCSVRDTGCGIESDRLESVFDPFTQADNSSTRQFGGAGLGLAICRELVTQMGGKLSVDSMPTKGSRFTLEIPLEPCSVGVKPLPDQLLVLLVEDNPTNQQVAKKLLERLGCAVEVAENGEIALRKFAEGFGLIFMDCHMPVMDGFEATREIRRIERELGRRTPIVALTAASQEDDRRRCFEAGMDEVIIKPARPKEIRATLERYLFPEQQVA